VLSESSLRARLAALACVLIAAVAVTAAPASAHEPAAPGFTVEFGTFKKTHRHAADLVRRSGSMRAVVDEVNARWTHPIAIPILFADEIPSGPVYLPKLDLDLPDGSKVTALINFPGPFFNVQLENVRKQFRGVKGVSTRAALNAAVQFVLAHEIGHALIDQYDLPVLGKEEDAADAFAAYLLADNPKFGPLTAISAAAVFDAMVPMKAKLDDSDWADEHSYPRQRVFQYLCWVYGSDPGRFKAIAGKNGLPRDRAARCGDEWKQINRSWDAVLAPHVRTG
jgi:hypothetical protein